MTEEHRKLLDEFSQKVIFIKEQLREKNDENQKLNKVLNETLSELEMVRDENQNLKYNNDVLRVSRSLEGGSEEDGVAKKRIGELVREIDKCIELLNE